MPRRALNERGAPWYFYYDTQIAGGPKAQSEYGSASLTLIRHSAAGPPRRCEACFVAAIFQWNSTIPPRAITRGVRWARQAGEAQPAAEAARGEGGSRKPTLWHAVCSPLSIMLIELLGLICCGWTTLEVTRLIVKGMRAQRSARSSSRMFGAWDGRGETIDVEVVD